MITAGIRYTKEWLVKAENDFSFFIPIVFAIFISFFNFGATTIIIFKQPMMVIGVFLLKFVQNEKSFMYFNACMPDTGFCFCFL